jgi:hypothetical protein
MWHLASKFTFVTCFPCQNVHLQTDAGTGCQNYPCCTRHIQATPNQLWARRSSKYAAPRQPGQMCGGMIGHHNAPCCGQAMLLADLRDHMDLHGLGQAQEYLNNKLDTDNNSPLRRLLDTMQEFREVQ